MKAKEFFVHNCGKIRDSLLYYGRNLRYGLSLGKGRVVEDRDRLHIIFPSLPHWFTNSHPYLTYRAYLREGRLLPKEVEEAMRRDNVLIREQLPLGLAFTYHRVNDELYEVRLGSI